MRRARTVTIRTPASIPRVLHLPRVRLQDFCKRKIFRHSVAEAVHMGEEHLPSMAYGVLLELVPTTTMPLRQSMVPPDQAGWRSMTCSLTEAQ